jgi:hypothetical protein
MALTWMQLQVQDLDVPLILETSTGTHLEHRASATSYRFHIKSMSSRPMQFYMRVMMADD